MSSDEERFGGTETGLPAIYAELRRIAGNLLAEERAGHTLQPTALVHEAYLRLANGGPWRNATHFKAVAAGAMRHVLVDHARARRAEKRGGDWERITLLDDAVASSHGPPLIDIVALDQALGRLEELSPRQGQVVELRWFGGLTIEEAASFLDVNPSTVKEDWDAARAFLRHQLRS